MTAAEYDGWVDYFALLAKDRDAAAKKRGNNTHSGSPPATFKSKRKK